MGESVVSFLIGRLINEEKKETQKINECRTIDIDNVRTKKKRPIERAKYNMWK